MRTIGLSLLVSLVAVLLGAMIGLGDGLLSRYRMAVRAGEGR